jgi:hypothetical protein
VTDAARAKQTTDVLVSIGAVYDHVAHAVPSIRKVLPLYRDLLGGVVYSGGINSWGGHVAVHIQFPGGAKIELLEPVRRNSRTRTSTGCSVPVPPAGDRCWLRG